MSRGADGIAAIAVLSDALRRTLYEFIRRQRRAVSRDEAAEHCGISRRLAAFHLDKLTRSGLLHSHYAPPEGALPRPGRRPKLYEPADVEFLVSVPQRQYDLLGEILVDAVIDSSTAPSTEPGDEAEPDAERDSAAQVALRVAGERGEALGGAARSEGRLHRLGPERALTATGQVLTTMGYEPYREPRLLCLRNCPFHRLAKQAPDLVCGLNHAFIAGLLRGLRARSVDAVLAPREGRCCVEVRTEEPAG